MERNVNNYYFIIRGKLTSDKISLLEAVGMVCEVLEPWVIKFQMLENFYKENGHLHIPSDLVVDGVWLNKYLNTLINAGEGKSKQKLTDEQRRRLEAMDIKFYGKRSVDLIFESKLQECRDYYHEQGHLNVSSSENPALKSWLISQKAFYRRGKLNEKE